ncbi:MAG: hypothetical protein RO257_05890 [Candidatus Kapabacteria bacterium]|nr:hypothetical protein [Candidatus Kapabacteria bacterium]
MATFRFKILLIVLTDILLFACSDDKSSEQVINKDSVNSISSTDTQQQIKKDTSRLITMQVPVDKIESAEFTDDEINQIKETGEAVFVINLRNAFTDYLKGKMSSEYFEPSAVKSSGDNLTTFDKSYFKSKFFVLKVDQGFAVGGVLMDILFKDKPDKVFSVWMFETENIYKLRMIEHNNDYSSEDIKTTQRLFAKVFKRDDCAF